MGKCTPKTSQYRFSVNNVSNVLTNRTLELQAKQHYINSQWTSGHLKTRSDQQTICILCDLTMQFPCNTTPPTQRKLRNLVEKQRIKAQSRLVSAQMVVLCRDQCRCLSVRSLRACLAVTRGQIYPRSGYLVRNLVDFSHRFDTGIRSPWSPCPQRVNIFP